MNGATFSSLDWTQLIQPGNRVFIGSGAAVPHALIRSMLEKAEYFKDVELVHMHTFGKMPWIDEKFDGSLRTNTFFLRPAIVEAVARGMADYTPCPISDIPWLFQHGDLPIDVALIQVTPPDANGMVSLGVSVDITLAAIKSAKRVVAQINPRMPRTHGKSMIPLKSLTAHVEYASNLPVSGKRNVDRRQDKIAKYTAQLIDDGACLQVSLGNTPQHVLTALDGHSDLGIHSGLLTDGFTDLIKSGVVTNRFKTILPGKSVCSHALGGKGFYEFIDDNESIEFHPSEWVNDPNRIAKNKHMVAINGAREVDITGQVVRDSQGHHFYGGIGAIQDFVRGAGHSRKGRPIITLTSTNDEGTASRIVAALSPGSGVCTSRGDVHYVVTEYGVASLHGRSIRERVLALTEVAHPDFREGLLAEARDRKLIPAFFTVPSTSPAEGKGATESRLVSFAGQDLLFRPLHPSDMRSLQQFFYSHDPETVKMRFGHQKDRMNSQGAYKLTAVDQRKDLALGLFERVGGRSEIRAIGRFYLDRSGESAEVAFIVHEKLRRLGIARFLLIELSRVAKERGVKKFWASVLKRNKPMSDLFLDCGAERESFLGEDSDEFWMDVANLHETLLKKQRISTKKAPKKKKVKNVKSSDKLLVKNTKNPKMKSLGVIVSGEFLKHDTGANHPECPARIVAIQDMLKRSRIRHEKLEFEPAKPADIQLAHEVHYHDLVKIDVDSLSDQLRTGDTPICPDSYEVAMAASGAAISAVDAVISGKVKRVFCATRPPGHHATPDLGMGFCIFNHVAVAAKHALERHGLKRVAILDWDVHHGNGTQDICLDDERILFFSTHEANIYPHTGFPIDDPLTHNVELPHGSGDQEIFKVWDETLEPLLADFKPELILISAGFDARTGDPIGGLELSDKGFEELTKRAVRYAEAWSEGRIVSVLEGGYQPEGLAQAVKAHLKALI